MQNEHCRWIPVDESKPEATVRCPDGPMTVVLVATKGGDVLEAIYYPERDAWELFGVAVNSDVVVAWMSLPPPPDWSKKVN